MSTSAISNKYPRNLPCPCGSGKKYKKCCINKDFDYAIDNSGSTVKEVGLSDKAVGLLKAQQQAFIDKFGREPEENEPIFFDPDCDEPTPLSEQKIEDEMVDMLRETGMRPQFIYAYKKTGFLLTAENESLVSEQDVAEWDAAIDEYFEMENPEDNH